MCVCRGGGWEEGEQNGNEYEWLQGPTLGYFWDPWTGLERQQIMSTCNARGQGCVAKMFCAYRP